MKLVLDTEFDEIDGMPKEKTYAVYCSIGDNGKRQERVRFFGNYSDAVIQLFEEVKRFRRTYTYKYLKSNYVSGWAKIKVYKGTLNSLFFESLNDLLDIGDEGSAKETQKKIIDTSYSMFSKEDCFVTLNPAHLTEWQFENLELLSSIFFSYLINKKDPLIETMMPILIDKMCEEAKNRNPYMKLDDTLASYQKDIEKSLKTITKDSTIKALFNFTSYCEDNIEFMTGGKPREPLLLLTEREYGLLEYQKERLKKEAE